MRKRCLNEIHELARTDKRVCFIGSDLGYQTLSDMQAELSDQFVMEGICEANTIGMAAGLAMDGRIAYVNTIATFITRRALDQIAVDLCMHKLPVRLVGNGGGLVYAPLGSTHLAVEDIALMRALPNMTVVCPCDEEEMARFMGQTTDYPGPIYIRLAKGYDPVVSRPESGFTIGKAITCRDGDDVLLVTTGVTLQQALTAADALEKDGISAAILHMHTVKPLDTEALCEAASGVKAVVTVEEHTLVGGLGSACAETLMDNGLGGVKFARLGIPDIFPDIYGSQLNIMDRLGIDAAGIEKTVRNLMG